MVGWILLLLFSIGTPALAFLPASDSDLMAPGGKKEECGVTEFECGDHRCIPNKWKCDGDEDCVGGDDESHTVCDVPRTCDPSQFTCVQGGACVPKSWACDTHPDCEDGSDEVGCTSTCASDEFTCANGRCTQLVWKCDGEDDCGDGSDEAGCQPKSCTQNEFRCGSGSCISTSWVCDGDSDCPGGEDEIDCKETPANLTQVCSQNEFRCRDQHYCVHQAWVCDGDQDCPDGTDEDESRCGAKLQCQQDQFACTDGKQCVPASAQCSGHPECADHSDEAGCATPAFSCNATTQFDCFGDGRMCLPLGQVCDGSNNCGGWEDEPEQGCGVNECATNNGGCEQICVNTPKSYHCDCRPGFQLHNRKECRDVDECTTVGICSQTCINRLGSYKCDCVDGYQKDPATGRCKARDGRPSLIFAHKTDMRKIHLDRLNMEPILNTSTRSSCALDYDFKSGTLFWSDVMEEKIYSVSLAGGQRSVVVEEGVVTADGLAVDWVHFHLYWTDTGTNTISVSTYQGGQRATLVSDSLEEPRAITLHPGKGWMFWSDWGREPKIERAGMDGSHREVIVQGSVRWPNGLALDLVLDRLYWVDAKLSTIGSSALDGSEARIVLFSTTTLRHPFSIAVFEDFMYWSEWESRTIYRADKFTGQNETAITGSLGQLPMVIQIYHGLNQPQFPNHCLPFNGHCSHLCLPAPRISQTKPTTSCGCPDDMKLSKDWRTCVTKTPAQKTPTTSPTEPVLPAKRKPSGKPTEATEATILHGEAAVKPVAQDDTSLPVVAIISSILGLATLVILAGLFVVHRRRQAKHIATIKFDNPAFRRPEGSLAGKESRVSTIDMTNQQVSYMGLENPLHNQPTQS